MAHYYRFEIYIPVSYKVDETIHAVNEFQIMRFIKETCAKYKGMTQANPMAPPLFKGWWKEKQGKPVTIDHLTFLFGLVRVDQGSQAVTFFERWKRRLEGTEHQDVILLMHYPVQTIGDFF